MSPGSPRGHWQPEPKNPTASAVGAANYVGFGVPVVLAELAPFATYPSMLGGLGALAGACAVVVAVADRRSTTITSPTTVDLLP